MIYDMNDNNVMNPQYGNVGNLGDIIKHAALTNLLNLLLSKYQGHIEYIDTHTFRLSSECPDISRWLEDTVRNLVKYEDYYDYLKMESQVLDERPYRCSSGLAIDILKAKTFYNSFFVFSESDTETRMILSEQIKNEGITNYRLIENAIDIKGLKLKQDIKAVFLLVDPFELDAELWDNVCNFLETCQSTGVAVVVEVFTYDKNSKVAVWPNGPSGFVRPVSFIDIPPYHLAIYASSVIKDAVVRTCSSLGWITI